MTVYPIRGEEPQALEHWLWKCLNAEAIRRQLFGEPSPSLLVLGVSCVGQQAQIQKYIFKNRNRAYLILKKMKGVLKLN